MGELLRSGVAGSARNTRTEHTFTVLTLPSYGGRRGVKGARDERGSFQVASPKQARAARIVDGECRASDECNRVPVGECYRASDNVRREGGWKQEKKRRRDLADEGVESAAARTSRKSCFRVHQSWAEL